MPPRLLGTTGDQKWQPLTNFRKMQHRSPWNVRTGSGQKIILTKEALNKLLLPPAKRLSLLRKMDGWQEEPQLFRRLFQNH